MSADFLKAITAEKNRALAEKKAYYENLKKNMVSHGLRRYELFKKAISKPGGINLIAEIKKASPSAGLIREDFDAALIAKIYVDNHAAALSVLTEEKHFQGKLTYLKTVSEHCQLPVLMKDFIVHEYQIYEGAFYGASAVLLIVAMLSNGQLKEMIGVAHQLGLDCLVEVHEEAQIERAVQAGAEIIGVNNRDLRTLKVDVNNCLRMIPHIPAGTVVVAESGLKTREDVRRVQEAGAHAVLIGETFMRSPNIAVKIKEVMG